MSGYVEVPLPKFDGLDLRGPAVSAEVGYAVDCENVIPEGRRLRTRPGSTLYRELRWDTNLGTAARLLLIDHALMRPPGGSPNEMWVFGNPTHLACTLQSGGVGPMPETAAGAISGEVVVRRGQVAKLSGADEYYSVGRGSFWGMNVRRMRFVAGVPTWDVPSPSINGGAPVANGHGQPSLIGMSVDGRLLLSGFVNSGVMPGGATGDPTVVYATQPFNPMAVNTTDFFRVGAGDDQDVTALATWRELTFVFTRRNLVVVTGISGDNLGVPLFHRRLVEAAVGTERQEHVCVGREGVYFLGTDGGVYVTQGNVPRRISTMIDALFQRPVPSQSGLTPAWLGELAYSGELPGGQVEFVGQVDLRATGKLTYHDGALYWRVGGRFVGGVWVPGEDILRLDLELGVWTRWTVPVMEGIVSTGPELIVVDEDPNPAAAAPGRALWRFAADKDVADYADGTLTGDEIQRAAIGFDAYWRSSYREFDDGLVSVMQHKLYARAGTPTLVVYDEAGAEIAVPVAWRQEGGDFVGIGRRGHVGYRHAFKLAGSVAANGTGHWSVHGVEHHLRASRRTPLP